MPSPLSVGVRTAPVNVSASPRMMSGSHTRVMLFMSFLPKLLGVPVQIEVGGSFPLFFGCFVVYPLPEGRFACALTWMHGASLCRRR